MVVPILRIGLAVALGAGLGAVMAHYGGPEGPFDGKSLERTCVIEIAIERMTGKQSL